MSIGDVRVHKQAFVFVLTYLAQVKQTTFHDPFFALLLSCFLSHEYGLEKLYRTSLRFAPQNSFLGVQNLASNQWR